MNPQARKSKIQMARVRVFHGISGESWRGGHVLAEDRS